MDAGAVISKCQGLFYESSLLCGFNIYLNVLNGHLRDRDNSLIQPVAAWGTTAKSLYRDIEKRWTMTCKIGTQ